MALCRIEHLYFKNDLVYAAMRKLVQQQQAATAQQTSQTHQEGSDEAVEAEDLRKKENELKQTMYTNSCMCCICLQAQKSSARLQWKCQKACCIRCQSSCSFLSPDQWVCWFCT